MQKLLRTDRKFLWHPFTQHQEWERDARQRNLVIAKGRGVYLYDSDGKRYIDAVSSLWANLHGHNHSALNAAITKQLGKVAHSTFLGLTHEPGIRLAEALIGLTRSGGLSGGTGPSGRGRGKQGKEGWGLSRVFYSDNGATAVEVALKMSYQAHAQANASPQGRSIGRRGGASKTEFLALRNSYHGDTIGAVSVGGIDLFHKKFRPLLFKTHFAMSPHCLRCPFNKRKDAAPDFYEYSGENPKPGDARAATGCRWECLGNAESILKRRSGKISAAIIEPVAQGAAGILVAPPGYLKGMAALCKRYGAHLIVDEVAVGFGRTGKMFASEHEGVTPDLMCLAKGISGGYLPLAATLATEKIYRAFLGRYDQFKAFFHGHTYTGNPLATAAGLASLGVFRKEKTLNRVATLIPALRSHLRRISALPFVGHVRQAGLVAGIELVKNKRTLQPFAPSLRLGKKVCTAARKRGILARPLGDVIVVIPPLTIRENQLNSLMTGLESSIVETTRTLKEDASHRT